MPKLTIANQEGMSAEEEVKIVRLINEDPVGELTRAVMEIQNRCGKRKVKFTDEEILRAQVVAIDVSEVRGRFNEEFYALEALFDRGEITKEEFGKRYEPMREKYELEMEKRAKRCRKQWDMGRRTKIYEAIGEML